MDNNFKLKKYISKIDTSRKLQGNCYGQKYSMAVVIPVYGEYDDLGRTLHSLSQNDQLLLQESMVVLVINSPSVSSSVEYNALNRRLLRGLISSEFQNEFDLFNLNLLWMDAATAGSELPGKGGVGLARKLGMDATLENLDWNQEPLIISLDADTLVEPNYLDSIYNYFSRYSSCVGVSIAIKHQKAYDPEEESAIRQYEEYLNDYVIGLRNAGSPYAYFTIGSAMAFRAEYYIKAGGMKTHRGGEDFYFMQALRKLGEIGEIKETVVHPAPRISDRVPFGTGPRLKKSLEGNNLELYNPEIFILLGDFLYKVKRWIAAGDLEYAVLEKNLDKKISGFLDKYDFEKIWPDILKNNLKKNSGLTEYQRKKLLCAFHTWFDAFKTLKFIHYFQRYTQGY